MKMSEKVSTYIEAAHIRPHPDNPRKNLGDLSELAESIKKNGVLQNLTVVPVEGEPGEYMTLIGHRRYAAGTKAGVTRFPFERQDTEETMKRKIDILCDGCKKTIEIKPNLGERVIAKDKNGHDVTEYFFSCPNCQRKFTFFIADQEMRILTAKRRQIAARIKILKNANANRHKKAIEKLEKEDEAIKRQQDKKGAELKKRYGEGNE